MDADFLERVDAFETQVRHIEAPRELLARFCQVAGGLVDAVCVLKLSPEKAQGWIGTCREDLPAEALEAFVFTDEQVPALRVVRTTRIPMSMTDLVCPALREFLVARGREIPRPCTLFPLSIGDKLPFVVYVDREQALTAREIGLLTRMLMVASVQFARLIAGKRRQDRTGEQPDEALPGLTRLMAVDWVEEYRGCGALKTPDPDSGM